jgi:hypothetical protein
MPDPTAIIGEGASVGDLCGAVAVWQTVQRFKRSEGGREEDIGSARSVHATLNGLNVRIKLPQDRLDAARKGAVRVIQKVHIDWAIDDLPQAGEGLTRDQMRRDRAGGDGMKLAMEYAGQGFREVAKMACSAI